MITTAIDLFTKFQKSPKVLCDDTYSRAFPLFFGYPERIYGSSGRIASPFPGLG
jgi:hypothetical protein